MGQGQAEIIGLSRAVLLVNLEEQMERGSAGLGAIRLDRYFSIH